MDRRERRPASYRRRVPTGALLVRWISDVSHHRRRVMRRRRLQRHVHDASMVMR